MSSAQPQGYLALPAADTGSPVLVLHAWWGLNDTIKAFCQRLAEAGFVAFAPDIYHGRVTDQIAEAEALAEETGPNFIQTRAALVEAIAFLKARAGATASGVAVVGFSMGAFYALDLAVNAPESVHSVVIFYGTGPTEFSQSKADFLGHFAENDPFEPQSSVDGLEAALKMAGRPVTFYRYDGVGHWFFEPDRADAYNPAAAGLAWDRTLAFLKRPST
ncbi:MAG: dienelactone hydrolase family protein [Anaerolineaceae bacterium]|nr:dienelactone hydrolase family protein [Anaerolineaceae bacterium]